MSQYIVAADTDETQAYVFESDKLPEIRGASIRLDDLNRDISAFVAPAQLVYANGGAFLAVVDDEASANVLVDKIEQLYPQNTGTVTITAVATPIPADATATDFGSVVDLTINQLRRRKESKAPPPFVECLPFQKRCTSCQQRPAVRADALRGELRCAVCERKREKSRGYWFEQMKDRWPDVDGFIEAPYSVQEITAATSSRSGFVGMIYLDGDRIGRLLQKQQTQADYKQLSKRLRSVTEDAVFDALERYARPQEVRSDSGRPNHVGDTALIYPFEILTLGGDDVMLLLPSSIAVPIALQICQQFERKLATLDADEPVTMSAGIVLADEKTPITILRDLASQSLKYAKKAGAGSHVDFTILKSTDIPHNSIKTAREEYPFVIDQMALTGRPYPLDTMIALWEGVTALRASKFPNSQMNTISQALLDGRSTATLAYLYQKKRGKPAQWTILDDLIKSVQAFDATHDPMPWKALRPGDEHAYWTTLWDIAELFDFVPRTP